MVKQSIRLCFFLFFIPLNLFCDDIQISAEVNPYSVSEKPLQGTITVTHHKKEHVDEKSFKLQNQPLEVEFVKDVEFSPNSDLILSLYNFTLPAQPPGLQMLPEITATIDKKKYTSIPSSYTVSDQAPSRTPSYTAPPPPARQNKGDRTPIILRLETLLEGNTTIYPGQRITVGYRFLYNFNVDLNKEDLPLLKAEGFEKIGAKKTNAYMKGDMNILEIKQTIEAEKIGTYTFPSGIIQGRAYRTNNAGQKETAPQDSQASSDQVNIQVIPFPEINKPASFNGAIGTALSFQVTLLSPNEVDIGDKVELFIKISGASALSEMPMPTVCCQPGFSGFFAMSDLPPIENLNGQSKSFKVEMRPQSLSIKEIPALEFSYFDPEMQVYKTIKSAPIPLKVKPLKKGEHLPTHAKTTLQKEKITEEPSPPHPDTIEIGGNELLSAQDLKNIIFGSWWVILIIPCGIAFLLLQMHMRSSIVNEQKMIKQKKSADFFHQAMQHPPESAEFFNLVQKAFLLRLVERGEITSETLSPDFLPTDHVPGRVRALIREIEERRFAAVGGKFDKSFINKIQQLFEEITP